MDENDFHIYNNENDFHYYKYGALINLSLPEIIFFII